MAAKVASSRLLGSPPSLSPLERELVCAVLEDCVDQLAVLGGIAPSHTDRPTAIEAVMGDELVQILESQRQLEQQYEWAMDRGMGDRRDYAHSMASAAQVARSPKAVSENMQKLEKDREFLQKLVQETMGEMGTSGTFNGLRAQLQDCHQEKTSMEEAILREAECRRRVRELEKRLVGLRKEREEEIIALNEQIAHLKDQLQELKAKTNLEAKYIAKESKVKKVCVAVSQCRHRNKEESLESKEANLQQQLKEEALANHSIKEYLEKHYEDLATQLDHWMIKYEQDLEAKSLELHDIKQAKASGLQKLEELSKTYKEYEEVVVEHRAMKEKQRLKEEQEARERRAATKLQAWWRGMMVRKRLGPFAPKKKGKGKKGKGKKGKKGKKKKK